MREGAHKTECELVLLYVSGECSEGEKLAFEQHLPNCPDCRKELEELREVWEVLSDDMERLEPPKELKKKVLSAAFAHEKRSNQITRFNKWRHIAIAAGILGLLTTGILWDSQMRRDQMTPLISVEEALSVSAAQIERLVTLQPLTDVEQSYGVACIVNNGQDKQFIVYVFGAKQTVGEEAYQVWLINENERTSAGTFRVDAKGIGVLAMPIASENLIFDGIGITLEPNDRGDKPRGEKAFAS